MQSSSNVDLTNVESNVKNYDEIIEKIKNVENNDDKETPSSPSFVALVAIISSVIFATIVFVGCIALSIAFVVYEIVGMVNTPINKQHDICNSSQLWIYNLVSLILVLYKSNIYVNMQQEMKQESKKNENVITFCAFLFEFLITLGMGIWGIHEFYNVSCVDELKNVILYKSAFIYFIFSIIYFIILCLLLFIIVLLKCKVWMYGSKGLSEEQIMVLKNRINEINEFHKTHTQGQV